MRTKEVNKVRERFVKDIEVKREVCFTSLAWMPAYAGMTHFNGVNPFQFLALNLHFIVCPFNYEKLYIKIIFQNRSFFRTATIAFDKGGSL